MKPTSPRYNLLLLIPLLLQIGGQLAARRSGLLMAEGFGVINPYAALSYSCLILRGIIWIALMRRLRLVGAYPVMSLSYLLIPLLAHRLFEDPLPPSVFMGGLLVAAGVVFIGLGEHHRQDTGGSSSDD